MNADLDIPLIDLGPWRAGDADARAELVARLDHAMQTSGFFLVGGHGIDPALPEALRTAARRFFTLPLETKQQLMALDNPVLRLELVGDLLAPAPSGLR